MNRLGPFAVVLAAGASVASANLQFNLVAQLDTAALGAGVPGSVAVSGDDVYVGSLFTGGTITKIENALSGTPTVSTFGSLPAFAIDPVGAGFPDPTAATTNGYVSLDAVGNTLVAATNNGGVVPDLFQVFDLTTGTLTYQANSNPGTVGGVPGADIGGDRIDGAAVDPNTGNVLVTAFGSGTQHLFSPNSLTDASDTPSTFFDGGAGNVGTGWRDVDFDDATGDVYLRAINGVAKGIRVGQDDYERLDGGAGIQTIVQFADGFNSAINVEFVSGLGTDLVVFNTRNSANTFADQIQTFDANGVNVDLALEFFLADGATAFTTADASSGIYDFSFKNGLLYVSDFSSSQIHVFELVPSPGVAGVFGVAGLAAARRRRA